MLGPKNNEFSGHYVCHAARLQRRMGSLSVRIKSISKFLHQIQVIVPRNNLLFQQQNLKDAYNTLQII